MGQRDDRSHNYISSCSFMTLKRNIDEISSYWLNAWKEYHRPRQLIGTKCRGHIQNLKCRFLSKDQGAICHFLFKFCCCSFYEMDGHHFMHIQCTLQFYSSINKAGITDSNYHIPFKVAVLTGYAFIQATLPLLTIGLVLLLKLLSKPEANFFDYPQQ